METIKVVDHYSGDSFEIPAARVDVEKMVAATVPQLLAMEAEQARLNERLEQLQSDRWHAVNVCRVAMSQHGVARIAVGDTLAEATSRDLRLLPVSVRTADGQDVADIVSAYINAQNLSIGLNISRAPAVAYDLPPLVKRRAA